MTDNIYPCPCCGYLLHDELPGPNRVCLIEAQTNFITIAAKDERARPHVRSPTPEDKRDPEWRPIDPSKDRYEESDAGRETGNYFPEGTQEYYWRKSD